MIYKKVLLVIVTLLILSTIKSCKYSGTGPTIYNWEFLGFEDKFALRLVLAETYLYVCAGSDGLWRRNIQNSVADWQYLGLADTSLGRYANVGVLDVDVKEQDILVAYNGSAPHVVAESTVGIWRSIDAGRHWFRSDNGIPETIDFSLEHNIITSLQRSPHLQNIVISVISPAVYQSTDDGNNWRLIWGMRGVISGLERVVWHPFQAGEVWFFGETALFAPILCAVQNYGLKPKAGVNFDTLGFPSGGSVNDIAFDAGNPNIVYAVTSYGAIKTTDGGFTWQTGAVRIPDNGYAFCMAQHPTIPNRLFLAGGKHIYISSDGGENVKVLGKLSDCFIQSLALDVGGNKLFIGTTKGVYSLKLN